MLRELCARFFLFLQNFRLYRAFGRRLARKRIRCCTANAGHAHGLSQLFGYEEWNYQGPGHRLVATLAGHIVGIVTIICFDGEALLYPGWWISSLSVRAQYRGLGIGEQLVRKALQDAALAGATRVNLVVSEENGRAISLYQRVGLELHSIPGLDAQLEEGFRNTGKRKIIMSILISNFLHSNGK
ncbi:GNAT family N-acetyltransferase [Candidatus Poribacteria bacterium]